MVTVALVSNTAPAEGSAGAHPLAPSAPPHVEKRVPRAGRPVVVGVLGGLAVASLGAGLATFLVGSSAKSDAKDPAQPFAERRADADRAGDLRTVSIITTYAGLGLAVAAVVPLLVWPTKRSAAAFRITPVVGPVQLGFRATF